MFFVLSKILYLFIAPFTWIVLLFFWAIFTRKPLLKKRLFIISFLLLYFFSNEFILYKIGLAYQPKPTMLADSAKYSCGILLGGMTHSDRNELGFFTESSDRFIQTISLYHQKKIGKILVTGGNGTLTDRKFREGDFLEKELLKCGVDTSDIINENQSNNTYENGLYSKRILDSLQLAPPYVLITSATHMPRSVKVFTKLGLPVIPYPSNYFFIDKRFDIGSLLFPKADVMYKWQKLSKEWIGNMMYSLTGKA